MQNRHALVPWARRWRPAGRRQWWGSQSTAPLWRPACPSAPRSASASKRQTRYEGWSACLAKFRVLPWWRSGWSFGRSTCKCECRRFAFRHAIIRVLKQVTIGTSCSTGPTFYCRSQYEPVASYALMSCAFVIFCTLHRPPPRSAGWELPISAIPDLNSCQGNARWRQAEKHKGDAVCLSVH